jgi:O-acetyl-ADP-ribose deacetylase (regulator of RNase III)
MIHLTHGDILKHEADALVNTVNCMGVMGRGIALQFRHAFEDNYEAYRKAAKLKTIVPGQMFVFERSTLEQPRWIINFPTKRHWKGNSQIADIESGLVDLVRVIRDKGIRSIAIPPLGCGLGGLDWDEVRPLIEIALSAVPEVDAYLFEPGKAPAATEMVNRTRRPKLTTARAAVLGLMQNYLAGLMDVGVSLLEIHKLMYFLQVAGEPLKLKYKVAPFGPYAENLRHLLDKLEHHYVQGYGEGGDDPTKPIELVEGAGEEGQEFLLAYPKTRERFGRVSELIEGFESPYGMELLATVHWVADRQGAKTVAQAVEKVHNWSTRKTMFTSHQIQAAWDRLHRLGWFDGSLHANGHLGKRS